MSTTAWLFVYTAISFYCLAGSLMEHFAVDSGWSSVGEAEFRSVHIAQGTGILHVYIWAKIALTLLIAVLLFLQPEGVPVGLLWWSLAMLTISWAASFLVAMPIQAKIRKHKDLALIRRLIQADLVRVLTMAGHAVAVCIMVVGVLRPTLA